MTRTLWLLALVTACGGGGHGGDEDAAPAPDAAAADAAPPPDASYPRLNLVVTGPGTGVIVSDPVGGDCGPGCTYFEPGTSVTLTATAEVGSEFLGWGGPCTGTAECTVTMDQDRTVYAGFGSNSLTVVRDGDGFGTVVSSVAGIDCGTDCSEEYPAGTQVTLTATVGPDSYFLGFGAPCNSTDPCTVTVDSAMAVHARFEYEHGTTTFTATKQGDPQWEMTGWQVFYRVGAQTTPIAVWSLHHYDTTHNAFVPMTVHAPPYDTEVADRLAALGIDPGSAFPVAAWTDPSLLHFLGVIVPSANAPIGSTDDYASGPYIPKDLVLHVDADMYKGTTLVDPDFDSLYPTLATLVPGTTVDGWSHMTLSFGESTQFITGEAGAYHLHVRVYEQANTGNGWTVDIPITIVAPP